MAQFAGEEPEPWEARTPYWGEGITGWLLGLIGLPRSGTIPMLFWAGRGLNQLSARNVQR